MLQHVIETEILNLIFCAVDLLVGVLEFRLNDKGRRIAVPARRCMVRAGVAALGLNEGNVTVLMVQSAATLDRALIGEISYRGDDFLDKFSQAFVNVVDNDTDRLFQALVKSALDVTGHILLQHSLHIPPLLAVLREDSLRAQQASFLGGVPVELNRVGGVAVRDILRLQQNTEGLEDSYCTAAVIIRTWSSQDRRKE